MEGHVIYWFIGGIALLGMIAVILMALVAGMPSETPDEQIEAIRKDQEERIARRKKRKGDGA